MFNTNLPCRTLLLKHTKKNVVYRAKQIFILSKGVNSGKSEKVPFTNSCVILFQNEDDAETVYWLAYSLWKSRFWHQSLVGSLIPFLRIDEFKNEFCKKASLMIQEHDENIKNIATLKLLKQKDKQFNENINLINELRRVILHRYCRK